MELLTIIILFAFCFLLAGIEIFIIPGFGFAGIGACCCLVIANILTFSHFGISIGILVTIISLILCGLFCYWLMHSHTIDKYSLHRSIDSTAAREEQLSVNPGDEGTTVTRLALIGNADINGKLVEVKSADGFLDEGTPIIVVRVDEAQIIVKKK